LLRGRGRWRHYCAVEAAGRGLKPKEVLADSQYATEANCEKARAKDVELIGPLYGGSNIKDGLHLADFEYDEKDKLTRCPGGHTPIKVKKNKKRISVAFDNELCGKCEYSDNCPADWCGGKSRYVRYTLRELRVSRRRVFEATDEFKLRYRWRAGVEATTHENRLEAIASPGNEIGSLQSHSQGRRIEHPEGDACPESENGSWKLVLVPIFPWISPNFSPEKSY